GDVRFAIDAEHRAIGVEDRDRIEERWTRPLEKADGKYHPELARQGAEPSDRRVFGNAARQSQMTHILLDAEAWSLEELREENDLGSTWRRLTHELLALRHVLAGIPTARHL